MNRLDVFYRAFADYKKQTGESRECRLERNAIAMSNSESDRIDIVRTICTVEEDWIDAIENGLTYIEKAINESRQFIRSTGEIVPIEKVKRVSKDSVEHLAKHSDLITKESEGENLIPDKLYIVERLSDFAVYENRFLYMLLCYLNNFIANRYNKILELTNTYLGNLTINKTVSMNKRKMVLELKMTDEKQDDRYLKENNQLQPVIDRIDLLLKTVTHLQAAPLMQEVSKAPMLKPPVTKTNVLKMNRNFKGAVALYDFITAYGKPGYSVEKLEEYINPFPDDTAGEFAEAIMLTSFLTYKYGLGLKSYLQSSYEEEEKLRRAEESQKQKEQIIQLRRRIAESGCDTVEYMLLLEKRNKALEQDSVQLAAAKQEIEKLNAEADIFKENIRSLNVVIEEKQAEIELINQIHLDETAKLKLEHELEITALNERHKSEAEEAERRHKAEIGSLNIKIEALILEHESAVSGLIETHRAETERKDGKISELEDRINAEQAQYKRQQEQAKAEYLNKTGELQAQYRAEVERLEGVNIKASLERESLLREKTLSDSRFNALRKQHNLIGKDEDFTAQASFEELERQYKIFKAFFKDEWKKTKKQIRKEILKPDQGRNETGKP